jgi:hypothetical protein
MAYTTINKPSEYFNTVLYTGNATGRTISGVGFQPDWTWIKNRSDTSGHRVLDVVRGGTKELIANGTNAEITEAQSLQSWNSDGFVLGTAAGVNANTDNFVSWNWLANDAGVSNTDGDITSTVSANTTSGFSIVQYTGNGSASNIGHGLGSALKAIIIKKTSGTADWLVGHNSLHPTLPWKYGINLNNTDAVHESGSYFADTAPTNSVFRVEANDEVNTSGQTYIAYCFAEKKGFSKFGSYVGNGNADGPFIYTGMKPAFILIRSVSTTNWNMFDNKRSVYNVADETLWSNSADSEATVGTTYGIDILSNGFKPRTVSSQVNNNNTQIIYMAFAEQPLVGTNNIPTTAR